MYQHAQFGGAHRDVYGDISWVGDAWNDLISSLVVYPHWCVTLYEHINYGGKYKSYCAGNTVFRLSYVGSAVNDQVSSIRVSENAWALAAFPAASGTPAPLEDTGAFSREGFVSSSNSSTASNP